MLQVKVQRRQEALQVELEQCGEDMDKMAALLDEMDELNKNATDLDMTLLDRNIDKMMPELGFIPEDSDQLVAAYRYARSYIGFGSKASLGWPSASFTSSQNAQCFLLPLQGRTVQGSRLLVRTLAFKLVACQMSLITVDLVLPVESNTLLACL